MPFRAQPLPRIHRFRVWNFQNFLTWSRKVWVEMETLLCIRRWKLRIYFTVEDRWRLCHAILLWQPVYKDQCFHLHTGKSNFNIQKAGLPRLERKSVTDLSEFPSPIPDRKLQKNSVSDCSFRWKQIPSWKRWLEKHQQIERDVWAGMIDRPRRAFSSTQRGQRLLVDRKVFPAQ